MQVIYKSVLAFKNCQAVFLSHSSGALPVLAITGFSFCCKTNEKPYILAPTGVPEQVPFWTSGRAPLELLWAPLGHPLWELSWASSGAFVRALWNTSWAKQGRGMAGMANIKEKHCILCASCAEPSEARLRAADDSALSLFVTSVSKEIEDASDLQKRASF